MKSWYNDSRSRSFNSVVARVACARWVIQVVAMEADAPTKEPTAAAIAVTTVASIVHTDRNDELKTCTAGTFPAALVS